METRRGSRVRDGVAGGIGWDIGAAGIFRLIVPKRLPWQAKLPDVDNLLPSRSGRLGDKISSDQAPIPKRQPLCLCITRADCQNDLEKRDYPAVL